MPPEIYHMLVSIALGAAFGALVWWLRR